MTTYNLVGDKAAITRILQALKLKPSDVFSTTTTALDINVTVDDAPLEDQLNDLAEEHGISCTMV